MTEPHQHITWQDVVGRIGEEDVPPETREKLLAGIPGVEALVIAYKVPLRRAIRDADRVSAITCCATPAPAVC